MADIGAQASATATLAPAKLSTGIGAQTMFRQIGSTLGVAAFVAVLGTPTRSTVIGVYADTRWLMLASVALAALALAPIRRRPGSPLPPGTTAAPNTVRSLDGEQR
ncbi:hypothetical protein [Nonomuraea sp. NPDC050786]|uniref:hypothetical protein n=1 Tax=Nonomuraea sp. NPDC050786 TaxID=3154840 RepID=UPI0033D5C5FC